MKNVFSSWLFAACAACTGAASTQVVTGTVASSTAVAVRAVSGSDVVTAGRVRSDGSFTLSLPAGKQYSLEVMTSAGAILPIGTKSAALTFKVCQPTDPWDMGGVGGGAPPPPCDPASDPNCKLPPPPPCDPASDPNCVPPPPPCDPVTDPNCKPPPPPPCDPTTDPSCQLPPPPCADPNDPNTCKDPCMADPSQCACGSGTDPTSAGSGSGGTCWPPPLPPGDCTGAMPPDHPPGDFGCAESGGK
jgi:hypothetical protein